VREAPVLAANLRASCGGGVAAARYAPQPHFLALLNTADGRALLRWHGVLSHSRAAWHLKDWIDRRYVRRYQSLYAGAS
jgi:selenide,water dikinase